MKSDKTIFGFWIYLMSDCLLFASLFAVYAVLHYNTLGGPGPAELFSLPFVLTETLILLTSSFACGLAILSAYRGNKNQTLAWLAVTLLLGISFLYMEVTDFVQLAAAGHSWTSNGFLSSFFSLVGTHGLHVAAGSLWMLVLMLQIWLRGVTPTNLSRLLRLSLFWHFLDIVWIFIFTLVYLQGVL